MAGNPARAGWCAWVKIQARRCHRGRLRLTRATMELESSGEGVLAKLLVPDGTEQIKVGDVIAVLTKEGEEWSAPPPSTPNVPNAVPDRLPRVGARQACCVNDSRRSPSHQGIAHCKAARTSAAHRLVRDSGIGAGRAYRQK